MRFKYANYASKPFIHKDLAENYELKGDYLQALDHMFKYYSFIDKGTRRYIYPSLFIASVYRNLEQFDESEEILNEINPLIGPAASNTYSGWFHEEMGYVYLRKNMLEKAKTHIDSCSKYYAQEASSLHYLKFLEASYYQAQNQPHLSLEKLNEADEILEKRNSSAFDFDLAYRRAIALDGQSKEHELKKAITIAQKNSSYKQLNDALLEVSDHYYENGDWEKAYSTLRANINLKDSIQEEDLKRKQSFFTAYQGNLTQEKK